MRKTNLFSIIFLILIAFATGVLSGCVHTRGTLKIKGKILDEVTNTGIPGKNIIIQAFRSLSGNRIPTEVALFSTDSTGSFSIKFKKIKDARYYKFCMAGDSDYLFTERTLGLYELEKNAEYLSFSLSKLAELKINLHRQSNKPARDTIRLIWQSDGVYGGSLYPYKIYNFERADNSFGQKTDNDLIWIGGKVNSTINTKVFAGKRTELTWELYRNGRRKIFVDTITCKRDFVNVVNFTY